ncbi:MAG: S24/S26 family peptidase [Candidatus Nanopelagicales bacterium]
MTRTRDTHLGLVLVRGPSMRPTFSGLRRVAVVCFGAPPRIGDVVVADRPDRPGQHVIKRITDRDARGWWLESDANQDRRVYSDSWLFGAVSDAQVLGVVRWPRVSR